MLKRKQETVVRAAVCEAVESRVLFAATATLGSGVLTVLGTGGADYITISKSGSNYSVKLNPTTTKTFAISQINSIVVQLGASNDSLLSYNDVTKPMLVFGGSGGDSIRTGGGHDTVYGEAGNDSINTRDGNDVMDGGADTDTADYSDRTANLSISLDDVANDGGPGGSDNVKSNVENIIGGVGNDLLKGSSAANNIFGFKGNDTIYGYGGNDTLDGGNGTGDGSGQNYVDGGSGNDYVEGGTDRDTLLGGSNNDTVVGDAGNDSLDGGTGNDVLKANAGNDTVKGGDGNDALYDEVGNDTYYGDAGNDSFVADPVNDTQSDTFDGGSGTDTISYIGRSRSVRIQPDGVANDGYTDGTHGPGIEKDNVKQNIENLIGTNYADGIYASGTVNNLIVAAGGTDYIAAGPGNDTVYGGTENDFIYGEDGNDTLYGDAGNDWIDGGNGNDNLSASSGNDTLYGQSGQDTLTGGSGNDKHYGGSGNDRIYARDGIYAELIDGGTNTDWADIDTFSGAPMDALTSIESFT